MRTTLIIDDRLLARARELTGIQEKTALVRAGLEALIGREAGKRLAALGGLTTQNIQHSAATIRLMLLADTSVWIEHFRHANPSLADRLSEGLVLMHPFVSGELACGNLKDRATILSDLHALPAANVASNTEVLHFIEKWRLSGRGLGWIDVHLLASAMLSNCRLWTLDNRLARAAAELGLK